MFRQTSKLRQELFQVHRKKTSLSFFSVNFKYTLDFSRDYWYCLNSFFLFRHPEYEGREFCIMFQYQQFCHTMTIFLFVYQVTFCYLLSLYLTVYVPVDQKVFPQFLCVSLLLTEKQYTITPFDLQVYVFFLFQPQNGVWYKFLN